jgi:hypothetical protein
MTAAVLGWFTAGEVGLAASAGDQAGVLVPEPSPETDWAEPAMRRTVGIGARRTPPTEERTARAEGAELVGPSAVPRPAEPEPEPEAEPVLKPQPKPSIAPVPAAVPTVRHGSSCSTEGNTGMTRSGDPVVCTASPGNGRTRWRHA